MTEFQTPPTFLSTQMEPTSPSGETEMMFQAAIPFLMVVCILGVLGNALVLAVYTRKRNRRSNAAMYILNLALGDMLAIVVAVFHITELFNVTWPVLWRTDLQCALHRYFRFVTFNLTVFTMVAIAIDRYFAVIHPLRFRLFFSARRTQVICVVTWVMALLTAFPTTFMFKAAYSSDPADIVITYDGKIPFACKVVTPFGPWWPDFKSIYLNIVLFYVPAIVTAAIYIIIVVHIRRNARPHHNVVQTGAMSYNTQRRLKSWKSARSLLMVFAAFVLCYGSFATYNVLSKYTVSGSIPAVVFNICILMPYANSCMNPIIYSFVNPSFRTACRELLCRHICERTLPSVPRDTRDDTLRSPVVLKGVKTISGSPDSDVKISK